jgi:hypothetical protein
VPLVFARSRPQSTQPSLTRSASSSATCLRVLSLRTLRHSLLVSLTSNSVESVSSFEYPTIDDDQVRLRSVRHRGQRCCCCCQARDTCVYLHHALPPADLDRCLEVLRTSRLRLPTAFLVLLVSPRSRLLESVNGFCTTHNGPIRRTRLHRGASRQSDSPERCPGSFFITTELCDSFRSSCRPSMPTTLLSCTQRMHPVTESGGSCASTIESKSLSP